MSGLLRRASQRWLALANGTNALFLALPFLAPVLLYQGRADLANAIYDAFYVTCHEWPFRAYFLFGPQATYSAADLQARGVEAIYAFRGSPELGYKVAFCARNVAIYAAVLAGGLGYAHWRGRLAPLPFGGYCALIGPMAVDGLTQLVGWRESTWELRTLTGALFGLASVWLLYPRIDAAVGRPLREPGARLAA